MAWKGARHQPGLKRSQVRNLATKGFRTNLHLLRPFPGNGPMLAAKDASDRATQTTRNLGHDALLNHSNLVLLPSELACGILSCDSVHGG